jgi:hypothetical protein
MIGKSNSSVTKRQQPVLSHDGAFFLHVGTGQRSSQPWICRSGMSSLIRPNGQPLDSLLAAAQCNTLDGGSDAVLALWMELVYVLLRG